MRMMLLLAALAVAAPCATATTVRRPQTQTPAQTRTTPAPNQTEKPTMKTAAPADVSSIDAIVHALYEVISGPAGQTRDEQRFLSLFAPGARLIPAVAREGGGAQAVVLTPEEFYQRLSKNTATVAFYEREIARQTQAFGRIAHLFSTYESRHAPADKPFARGINSIQLLRDGGRWWVVTIFWDSERPDNPLPKEYLPR